MFDIILRNGNIADGTGNPTTKLDIGISNGKIKYLGNLTNIKAKRDYDVSGLVVSPGFIDAHTHSDLLCTKPEIYKIKLVQGVTTELLGQDGLSVAPVSDFTKPLWQKQLKGLNGDIGDWPWETVHEFLEYLQDSPLAGNVSYLVPHGAVRSLVMGFDKRTATEDELIKMKELVEEGMSQGAVGFSTGLIYPPNVYSNKKELIALCKGVAKFDGCFVVHLRNESNYILEALDEVIDVARQSGVRLHISHFKIAGKKNRHKYEGALEKMDQARREGIEVTFDQYPYSSGSTVLSSLLPPWVHDGGTEKMLERLKDSKLRNKIEYELENNDEYDNSVLNCGWDGIMISSVSTERNKSFEGFNLKEVSEMVGLRPVEVVFKLLVEENANVTMVNHWGLEKDVIFGMQHPLQMVGSDGIFGGKPHPRLYGSFAMILGKYVREKKVLNLEEAIRKMTGAPAQLLRLKDRGYIRENCWADLVVFDPEEIGTDATYTDPEKEPKGIYLVIVNGQVTVDKNIFTGVTAGKVIRGSHLKEINH